MSVIKPLSPEIIKVIAAGEVAERPSVIVKELLENALDAGATQIAIHLTQGGLEKIVVSDNGWGMSAEDLTLAIKRYTTSKISHTQDLERIATFGFRGEALASIASVSRLTLLSRPPTGPGHQLVVSNDQPSEIQPVGINPGTTVIVEQLFAQVPARLKFQKSAAAEVRAIADVVTTAALSQPQVSFTLTNNDTTLLSVPAPASLIDRITTILGPTEAFLLPVTFEHPSLQIRGYVGQPQIARRSKNQQYVFVNHRPIKHTGIVKTIKQTFGTLLAQTSEPVFVIELEMPPGLVDVNTHPRKETVHFMDENHILQVVARTVQDALTTQDLLYQAVPPTHTHGQRLSSPQATYHDTPARHQPASPVTLAGMKNHRPLWQLNSLEPQQTVLQVHLTYLITQTPEGMVMVDQHAAHERILYEQLMSQFTTSATPPARVALTEPTLISLPLADSQLLVDHLELLAQIGITIEAFGHLTYRVTHLPSLLSDRDPTRLITELLDDLSQGKPITGLDDVAYRTMAYIACRQAIKAGDYLTPDQRVELLEKLSHTPHQSTCPHGRPTTIVYSQSHLERMFKRST